MIADLEPIDYLGRAPKRRIRRPMEAVHQVEGPRAPDVLSPYDLALLQAKDALEPTGHMRKRAKEGKPAKKDKPSRRAQAEPLFDIIQAALTKAKYEYDQQHDGPALPRDCWPEIIEAQNALRELWRALT